MPKIVFQSDASQVKKETAEAARSISNVASSAEQARKRIVESFNMQIAAAKEVGASQRELESITRRAQSMLADTTDNSAARQIKSLDRLEDKLRRVAAARKILGNPTFEEHYEPPPQSKASASIRALGGTPSVRAAESFASSVPFLSKAFDFAFPAIGAAALAVELGNGVAELVKMKKEATELPEHLRDAFEGLNAPLYLSVDNLRKTNDELELAIAKLEHKPANTLALSLDEARINADRLAESTDRAAASVKKLLEENKVGFKEWLITGQTSTGPFTKEINSRMKELQDLQRENRDALRSGSDTPQAAQAREANITGKLQSLYDFARKNRKDLQSFDNGSQTSNINILAGIEDWAGSTLDEQAQQKKNTALNAKKQQLEQDKALSQQATEAQRKAISDTKQLWEEQLAAYNSTGNVTLEEERKFWYDRINAVQQGSELYNYAQKKANDLLKQLNEQRRKQADELRKINDQWRSQDLKQLTQALLPGAVAQSKGITEAQTTGISLRDARRAAGYSSKEAEIADEASSGRLTRLDAAIQLRTLHTKQYNEQLKELRENLEAVQSDAPDAEAQRNRINQQITELNARRDQQVLRDDVTGSSGSSGSVGFRDALNDFVLASRDAASQMRSITQSILGGLNQNISAAIVGGRTNWADTFRGFGQLIAGAGLQGLEGTALGALGLGKPDGSISNPLWVRSTDSEIGGAVSAVTGSGVLGRVGGFISSIFGGGRAIGGGVDANTSYLVGERGPEILTMGSQSGRITPNSQIGGDSHYYTVDARGATDPAAVEAAVHRAISMAAPGIAAASVAAGQERNRRVPSTSPR